MASHYIRVEHKEKLAATTRLEQFMRKYERECERSATLEKENAFLVDQVSGIKDETEVRPLWRGMHHRWEVLTLSSNACRSG